jgi:class 3 adenylate cyclase
MPNEQTSVDARERRREAKDFAYELALAKTTEAFEDAVRSIAERTGTHPDTLRLALKERRDFTSDSSWLSRLRKQWRRMSAPTKRIAISGFLGAQVGAILSLQDKFGDPYGLAVIGLTIVGVFGLWNSAMAKRRELGATSGGAFGFAAVVAHALTSLILQSQNVDGSLIIPMTLGCALAGALVSSNGDKLLKLRFQHDPERRREELLKQLIDLQEELKQSETIVTFLCVDVVGSTRIKQEADPLAAEYSFGEYTSFVVGAARRFGGEVHSTAGDGVMLTFEHPADAFKAARHIQAGLLEFNTYRNKTGSPFAVRCGIHTGAVMAPGSDLRSVSYSHVIDVAAHAQRQAEPGGIAITEDSAMYLPGGPEGLRAKAVEVQGTRAYLWAASPASPPPSAQTPPPPPFSG